MTRPALVPGVLAASALLVALGCASAYQRSYDQETQRLEEQAQSEQAQQQAEHSEAQRYAAVVYFAVGSAALDSEAQRELRWFVEQMRPYPQARLLVQGFADTTGSEGTNQRLSNERAAAVTAYLASQGIEEGMIQTQAFSSQYAAQTNATAEGRRNNRRVEVTVR